MTGAYPRLVFESFTERARRIEVGREESRLLVHNHIGTEHILRRLIPECDGMAAAGPQRLGISLEDPAAGPCAE
jgi:hypothetical protein